MTTVEIHVCRFKYENGQQGCLVHVVPIDTVFLIGIWNLLSFHLYSKVLYEKLVYSCRGI